MISYGRGAGVPPNSRHKIKVFGSTPCFTDAESPEELEVIVSHKSLLHSVTARVGRVVWFSNDHWGCGDSSINILYSIHVEKAEWSSEFFLPYELFSSSSS
jgi:hypothetical protein